MIHHQTEREILVSSATDRILEQLRDIQTQREAIIEASTARRLERLGKLEAELRESLASLERVESQARQSIPETPEEKTLWLQIRDLMEREAALLHEKRVPERYVRADAAKFFEGDLAQRREAFDKESSGLKFNQTHGPRVIAKRQELENEAQQFATKIRLLCLQGEKLFGIRQQIKELSARRGELKSKRESKALATI